MACPFQINDEIVCIEVDESIDGWFCHYTINKIYRVVEIERKPFDNLGIMSDFNFIIIPRWEHFKLLKEQRKDKLKKINNEKL